MNNGATVLTRFTADTKDFDTKTKNVDKSMKSLASGIGKAFAVTATAVAAVTTAIGAVVKKSVEAYAEFEQLEGGLISLFGDGSKEMQHILQMSEDAYKNLTMSQNDYLTAFQSAYPLVNAGISKNADAIEYSNKMLQISADLFNTYGGSTEQYQNAINWALKGSFVYLDNLNLGIKGTQEGFIAAANASGVLGRTIQDVSEVTSDEIIDVIEHYAKEYGVLGKTAAEAGDTILGSINMMKASWTNFISGLSKDGADLDKLIDQLVTSIQTVAKNVVPVVLRAMGSLAKALPQIVQVISAELPNLINQILPPLIESTTILLTALVNALPGIITTIMPILVNSIVSLVNALVEVLPQLLPTIIQGIVLIIQGIAEALPTLMPAIVDAILEIIPLLVENIPLFIGAGFQLIMGLLQGIINSIPKILAKIPQLAKSIINKFKDFFANNPLVKIGVNLIKGLWNGIGSVKDWIIGKIGGFTKSVLKSIKSFFGIKSPSKVMAEEVGQWLPKGIAVGIDANTDAIKKSMSNVEREMMSSFQVSPQLANSSALHYSPSVIVNNQINMKQDPLGQMVREVKTFSGGAKNDYNYGMGV